MLKKIIATGALAASTAACAFAPQAGIWVIDGENNGSPGRGFSLDVQDRTLVMQMYAYDADGNPTFYLSSGPYEDDGYNGQLNQYRGGRFFGGEDRSGSETGSAGAVSMRFDSGTTGFITFPGEPEKAISRYSFAYPAGPDGLKGIWLFTALDSLTPQSDFVALEFPAGATETGNGIMTSSDGLFGCEHIVSGDLAGTVVCVKVDYSGQLQRIYQYVYSVNDGEGIMVAGDASSAAMAIMRRLADSSYMGTGVFFKKKPVDESGETVAANVRQVRAHIGQIARTGLAR
ncbi:hypothetical protein [Diaphorobacter ruginosibacter]|uniref:hypothetical protein n=1 Tax=Diaphorobacter ruginosibacter TaxID=1715720 RepID=UPI00333E4916